MRTRSLLAAVAAILMMSGCSAPSNVHVAPTSDVTVAPVSSDVEVSSESEASGIRGMTVGELMRDAWTSESALGITPETVRYTMIPEYVASYDGEPAAFPGTYFYVHSTEFPGVHHVFRWITAQKV